MAYLILEEDELAVAQGTILFCGGKFDSSIHMIIRDDVERPFLDVQMSETRLRNLRDAITKALRKIKKMEAKNQ